jgi:hypothetical protein
MKKGITLLVTLLVTLIWVVPVIADVNPEKLLKQMTKISPLENGRRTFIVWYPEQFWTKVLGAGFTDEARQKYLHPYTYATVVVVDQHAGFLTYNNHEVWSQVVLKDKDGNQYNTISPTDSTIWDLTNMIDSFLQKRGLFGTTVIFPGKNKKGKLIAEGDEDGKFSILYLDSEYEWDLPLDELD